MCLQYVELLSSIEGVECLNHDLSNNAPHIFVVKILDGKRDILIEALRQENIQCGLHYQPNHKLDYFEQAGSLNVVDQVYNEIITLPLHAELTSEDIVFIVCVIKNILDKDNV